MRLQSTLHVSSFEVWQTNTYLHRCRLLASGIDGFTYGWVGGPRTPVATQTATASINSVASDSRALSVHPGVIQAWMDKVQPMRLKAKKSVR